MSAVTEPILPPEQVDHNLFEFFQKQVAKGDEATMAARLFPQTEKGLKEALEFYGVDESMDAKVAKIDDWGGKGKPGTVYRTYPTNNPQVYYLKGTPKGNSGDVYHEFFRPNGGKLN